MDSPQICQFLTIMLIPLKKENTREESSRRAHAGRWIKLAMYHIGARARALTVKAFSRKDRLKEMHLTVGGWHNS